MLANVKQRHFRQSKGHSSGINDPIWRVFLIHLRFHPCLSYLQISGRSHQNWISYADDKIKQRLIQQSRGRNSKINDPIWLVFKLMRDFKHVHLSCKLQEVPIKTEQVVVMTRSIRGFCSNQGNVILKLMIHSGQSLNLSEISSMPTLSVSFRKIWSKLNELCWWKFRTTIKRTYF